MTLQEFYSEESRWIRKISGVYSSDRLEMKRGCIFAAIYHFYKSEEQDDVLRKIRNAAMQLFPERMAESQSIIDFNDHKDTKFEDIQAVVKLANV